MNFDPKNLALLNAGLGMMANSTGQNSGNALGMGLQQGVGSYQNSMLLEDVKRRQAEEQKRKAQDDFVRQQMQQIQLKSILQQQKQAKLKMEQEQATRNAMSGLMTPGLPLQGKGGQAESSGYTPPQNLPDLYKGMIGTGNLDLALQGMKGLQGLETRATTKPTSQMQNHSYFNSLGDVDKTNFMKMFRGDKWLNTGTAHVNPNNGESVTINPKVTEMPEFKAQQTEAIESAKAEVKQQSDNRASAQLAEEAMAHVTDVSNIAGKMSDYQLGPLAQYTPNWSDEAQLLDMKLKNLIGNVRDKLGPGILSDTDIKMLEGMLPHMGMDKSAFLSALDMFRNELRVKINRAKGSEGSSSGGEFEGFRVLR